MPANNILSGVKVVIAPHVVHISNDAALLQLLSKNTEQQTDILVREVLNTYQQQFNHPLNISAPSLAVEIWGHIYVEQFAGYINRLVDLSLIRKLRLSVQKYCSIIDCGEEGHDQNRWVWDLLAPFKTQIAQWLPGK